MLGGLLVELCRTALSLVTVTSLAQYLVFWLEVWIRPPLGMEREFRRSLGMERGFRRSLGVERGFRRILGVERGFRRSLGVERGFRRSLRSTSKIRRAQPLMTLLTSLVGLDLS
jgi:hypothetical protein